ncbi:hypothetical protein M3922_004413 [Vibrio parahaemolyticus]|nr:hypothetical protein [Vibrio parahaemolyticus]
MKITKAHIQIGILAIGGLSVAGMWLVPQFDTPPSISVPAKQTAPSTVASTPSPKALPDTVAPVVKKIPKPQSVTPTLTLDVNAQKLIKRSEQLAVAKMDSQIAEEKSRTRKANQKESSERLSDYVPSVSVIEQPYSPAPSTVSPHASQQAIDRFSLSGLFVDGNEASAYLALDGGQPFLVKSGDSVKGVSITNINGNGVRLKQGARIRVLEGGL